MINLIGPDGRKYTLDNEEPQALQDAQAQGFRIETPETPQTFGEKAMETALDVAPSVGAAGVGVMQGASAGLFRATLPKEDQRQLAKLAEEHPIASLAGELPGMALSPLNVVGEAVEGPRAATALARIGQKTVGGAAVGSLFGAGAALSDAALGDHQLTAEKLVASTGLGALLGGAGSGVFGALEEGVGSALSKLGGAKAQGALKDFANDRWLKAAGGIQSDIRKIPAAEHEAVADVVRQHLAEPGKLLPKGLDDALASLDKERAAVGSNVIKESGITDAGGLAPHMDRDAALEAISKAHDVHGNRIGAVYDAAEQSGARPVFSDLRARIGAMRTGLSPAERDAIEPQVQRIEKYIDELGAKAAGPDNGFRALNKLRSDLDKELQPIYRAGDTFQGNLRKRLVHQLRDELDVQLAQQAGPDLAKELLSAKREFGALARAEDALKRKSATGIDAIRALAEDASNAPPSLARLSALEHARNLLQHGVDRELGNRWLSASDYLSGIGAGVMHGGPAGAITGLATSVAHKFVREKSSAVIAGLADRLAASPSLKALAQSFSAKLPALAPQLGPFGAPLLEAAARSPVYALATHMTLARVDPNYAASAQLAGLNPEGPEEHDAAVTRAGGLATIGATAQGTDEAIARHIDSVLRGDRAPVSASKVLGRQDFGARTMRREAEAAHDRRFQEIQQLAADPNALLDRVSANLSRVGPVAPGVAAALSARAHAAVAFLAKAAERPPKMAPTDRDWTPTEAERFTFARKLEAVEEPLSVLRHAAAGTLTPDQVEALRTVYPKLMEQVTQRALERIVEKPNSTPYRAKLMLSMLTGTDVDSSLSPAAIRANQLAISNAAKNGERRPSVSGSPAGASKLSLAERMALPSQRRELEGGSE